MDRSTTTHPTTVGRRAASRRPDDRRPGDRSSADRRRTDRSPAVVVAIVVSLLAAALNITGALLDVAVLHHARWLYVLPLMVALLSLPLGRSRWGLLWFAGLFFSGVGDTQGGHGFLVLLGAFLVAHVFFIVALWPDRRRSLLGRPASLLHAVILVGALVVLVPAVDGGLIVPVVIYAVVLALMALLAAAAGPVGLIGGLLFMFSDLTLGIGMFAVDMPDGVQTLLVIGTYVPAQVLLLLAFLRLVADRSPRSEPPRATTARPGSPTVAP